MDAVNTDASRSDSYPRIFKYSMPDCNYSMHYYDENNRVCSDENNRVSKSALFCGIDNAFQVYTSHVIEELGMRNVTG